MYGKTTVVAQRTSAALIGCLFLMAFSCCTWANSPTLANIAPRGVQRGTETDVTLQGAHFEDAKELLVYSPGIAVSPLQAKGPGDLHAHLKIDANARVGEYCVRVRSETGISELRTLYVGPFPIIPMEEGKPDAKGKVYYDFDHPQEIPLNVTVSGTVANEQVQYFAVNMKKGQRLTAEVHGMRLGELFDPYVAILDEKRFELAVSDDTALAMQDPIASTIIPADGRYIILLRESSYGQGSHYLMHVGTYPRPTICFPLGGKPGEELHVQFLGDVTGPFSQTIKLPDKATDSLDAFPEQEGQIAPSPNHLRVSDMPNVMEKEPNDDVASATAYDGELPVAFNGIIEKPGDVDFFKFKAKKGQQLDLQVYARKLRSPLDSVLTLYNAKGGQIASNDDSGGPDSYIRFNVSEDGEYVIGITDQLKQGGLDYAYRVEINHVKQDLVFSIPQYAQNSQERWTVPVPRGNRYATLMRAQRINFGGEVSLSAVGLPDGITMQAPNPGDSDVVPVVFEARPDAPIGGKLCEITGKSADEKQKLDVKGHYEQKVDLVYGNNNSALYATKVDTLAVAVTKEAPFKLHLVQPKVPLVQGGSMELKVTAERAADFKAPIQVRLLFTPPNIGAISAVDMPGDKSEVMYPINAQQNAAIKTWKICVVGMSDNNGQLWVSSELIDLEIAAPYVLASTQMTAAEQGKTAAVSFKLDQKIPFDGKAKAKLLGLPANVTAEEIEVSSADKLASFPITLTDKAPPGNHPGLFCQLTIMKNGEPIVHNIGQGGTLRIDKPEPPKANQPAPAPVAANKPGPKPAAGPSLSRLEKLRQEQGQK
ncbi:MAG TPA: pre-peptidase C-terminal domain-containing protein [Tepidisphaeraceae bacterium]|jgi:hypothetical protein|nr:pre-peptidase C-terminal domain-containing protein [Tepidisphaeraceae bacterium]